MSKSNNKKNSIDPNDFIFNYQKAFNNYTNLIKFYSNNTQLMDSIEKIISQYKENIITFKKKLIQIKTNLIKPLYNEEKKSYKYEEDIYTINNNIIFLLNQIFNLQIDLITKFIKEISQNVFSEFEKKRINDFSNTLQQNKNNMQINQKKMENNYKEYNSEYKKFYEAFESIEADVQKYYIDRRRKKLEETNNQQINDLSNEANFVHSNFFIFQDKYQENNKKFFNIYNNKIKELEEETINNEFYIKSSINSFNKILINSIKTFLNSLENNLKEVNTLSSNEKSNNNEINNNNNKDIKEEEQPKNDLKELSNDLQSFESKYFAKLETNYKKEKYKVQAYNSRNKLLGDTQSFQDKKIMNSIFSEMDLEEFQDNSSVLLKDEDIYETMKFFYDKYEYVDLQGYDLVLERKKLEVKKLTYKLLQPGLSQKKNPEYKDIIPINENEVKKLENFMKKGKDFRLTFLFTLNFYRTLGIFDMPEREFEITSNIFVDIADILFEEKSDDFQDLKLLIILSETFYVDKDGQKYYLYNKLNGHKLFNDIDYSKKYLYFSIEEEFTNSKKKSQREINSKEKNDIVFANVLPFCKYMLEFGVPKQKVVEINEELYKKYELNQTVIDNINLFLSTT